MGGLIVLGVSKRSELLPGSYERRLKLVFSTVISLFLFVSVVAAASGRLVLFADVPKENRQVVAPVEGKLSFILSFERSQTFWTLADNGKEFHTLSPYEGLTENVCLLLLIQWGIVWLKRPRQLHDQGPNVSGQT